MVDLSTARDYTVFIEELYPVVEQLEMLHNFTGLVKSF